MLGHQGHYCEDSFNLDVKNWKSSKFFEWSLFSEKASTVLIDRSYFSQKQYKTLQWNVQRDSKKKVIF